MRASLEPVFTPKQYECKHSCAEQPEVKKVFASTN